MKTYYTKELKSWVLAASAWRQIFGLHSRLAIQQVRRAHLTSLAKERAPAFLQVSAGSLQTQKLAPIPYQNSNF